MRYEKRHRSKGFLATTKSTKNDSDSGKNDKWYQWGVSLVDLRQILEQSPVKRQIVILDCCHGGEVFNYQEIDPGNSEIVTRCLMSACAANQSAFEPIEGDHSYFTATLLEGWQQSKLISTYTLWEYVDANFKYKLQDVRRNDLNNQDLYQKPKCSNRNGELILFVPEVYPGTHPDIIEKGFNPYKGLEAFQEADAPYFFGRGKLTINLVNLIHDHPFLAVSGSSGSGKSSVVRAGLIPALKKGSTFSETANWKIYEPFQPGENPIASLAQVLVDENLSLEQVNAELAQGAAGLQRLISQTNRPCVLVVDQFERLFTQCPSDKRQQFLDCLCGAISSSPITKEGSGGYPSVTQEDGEKFSLRVVITIRDDFLGKCAEYPQLLKLININKEIVGPMNEGELRDAISKPLEKVGVDIPPDLENLMVADVQKSPGSLPLLQDLLQQMVALQYKERRSLTVQTYQADDIGGVQKALQKRAEKVYQPLTDEQKKITRSIFLKLTQTQLGENTTTTARQVRKSELTGLPPAPEQVEIVLEKLEAARLIVTRELKAIRNPEDKITVVDVAHESLISNWEQLKQWVNENPEVRRQQEDIQAKAQDWEDKGKRREGLLRGLDLGEAEAFVRRYGETFPLSAPAPEFVRTSIRQRRITRIVSISAVAAVLTVVTGLWLNAQRQATIANLRAKAAQAQNLLTSPQPLEGVLLAIQATGESQDQLGQVMSSVQDSLLESIQTLREQNRLRGHQSSVLAVAFSPDGQTIVSGSADNTLRLWNRQGEPIGEPFRGHQDSVWAVAFSPDGQTIVSGSLDNTVRFWNRQGEPIGEPLRGHQSSVLAVAFSPDGQTIVSGSADNTLRLWNRQGEPIGEPFRGHQDSVWAVAFSPDGQTIVSGSLDNTVRFWNRQGEPIGEPLRGHQGSVNAVAFSPDGQTIVSGSDDNTLRFWNRQGEPIGEPFRGHQSSVNALAFSPDGQTIVSGSYDSTLRLWNRQGEQIGVLRGHQYPVMAVAISADGQTIVSGSWDNTLRLWNRQGEPIGEPFRGHQGWVNAVAFSPDGQTIVSGSSDNTLRLWNRQGKPIGEPLRGHQGWVNAVAFSPDGQTIVSGSLDDTLRLWNRQGEPIGEPFRGHQDEVRAVAFSPDGQTIVSGSNDNTLRLWNRQGEPIGEPFRGHQDEVRAVAFSPDGQTIVSGSDDNTLRLWNRQGEPIGEPFRGHQSSVNAVAFSPDGQTIVSGSGDATLRLWNRQGEPIGEPLRGHQNPVNAVAFSPDGQTIVSGSADNTLRLWNRQGEPIGEPLRGHQGWVNAVAFSPDGQTIVSGSWDNTLRLWQVGDWKHWLQIACNQLQYHPVLVAPETDVAREAGETCQKYAWNSTESAQFLVRHGKALARDGDFPGAVTQFKRALKLDDTLDLDPEAEAKRLAVPALIAQGEQLAREARVEEAIGKFQQALKLDDSLNLNPEAKAIEIATSTLVKQGERLAEKGQIDEAIAKFQQAVSLDGTLNLDPKAKATELGVPVLVKQGKELAAEGKVDEAAEKFQAALKWDDTLELNPKSEAIQIATSALVEQGKQLARQGRVDAATEKFQQALKLDNTLNLNPETEAKQIAAAAVLEKAKQLVKQQKYKAAIEAYTEAQKIDSTVKISAQNWNEICWYGSLRGEAAAVLATCEKAVTLAPKSAGYRANLGIAKALTGDTEGAIKDFETFIQLSENEASNEQVQGYIDALRAGENPFTEAEIKRLLGE